VDIRDVPSSREETDRAVADRLEALWGEGEAIGEAGDLISGVINFEPPLSRNLQESWKLFNVRKNNEMPARAAPVWLDLVQAMMGYALEDAELAMACFIPDWRSPELALQLLRLWAGGRRFWNQPGPYKRWPAERVDKRASDQQRWAPVDFALEAIRG
jgi:hypothetical protein